MSSKSANASIARLIREFPRAFCRDQPKPLKIGAFEAIFARLRPHLARDDFAAHMAWSWRFTRQGRAISAALEAWTSQPAYLTTLTEGATRFDLEGEPAGVVTERQAAYAAECLERLRESG